MPVPLSADTSRVYPRACGGTALETGQLHPAAGLSPRLRGNHVQRGTSSAERGSIPAPAGEPRSGISGKAASTVYPRACGGTLYEVISTTTNPGLSPRLRGNLRFLPGAFSDSRSIPAPAGEPRHRLIRVYPRACGGTADGRRPTAYRGGLSPRLRGNRAGEAVEVLIRGSIPAPAGEPGRILPPPVTR